LGRVAPTPVHPRRCCVCAHKAPPLVSGMGGILEKCCSDKRPHEFGNGVREDPSRRGATPRRVSAMRLSEKLEALRSASSNSLGPNRLGTSASASQAIGAVDAAPTFGGLTEPSASVAPGEGDAANRNMAISSIVKARGLAAARREVREASAEPRGDAGESSYQQRRREAREQKQAPANQRQTPMGFGVEENGEDGGRSLSASPDASKSSAKDRRAMRKTASKGDEISF